MVTPDHRSSVVAEWIVDAGDAEALTSRLEGLDPETVSVSPFVPGRCGGCGRENPT